MELAKYLKLTKTRPSHLARQIKKSPALITLLKAGKVRPSAETAMRIEKATNGMVTRMELLYPKG